MMHHSTADLCQAVQGTLVFGSDTVFSGVSIDTRTIEPKNAFFCIRGPRFDGHQFASTASEKNASVIVINRDALADETLKLSDLPVPVVAVENTIDAMADFAAHIRRRSEVLLVGLTGSSGKTTTKEFVRAVLESAGPTLATAGNLNNHLGVPLTLMRLDSSHRFAVIEMGMNAPGEIGLLARIAAPNIGVVTTVGRAHLEGVGTLEGVARAKGELFDALSARGTAIFPSSILQREILTRGLRAPEMTVGTELDDDIQATRIRTDSKQTTADVTIDGQTYTLSLKMTGRHNLMNAMLALGVARVLEIDMNAAVAALSNVQPPPMRGEWRETIDGVPVLLDCYNANPQSMAAAVSHFLETSPEGVVVLGDMLELGSSEREAHFELGQRIYGWSKTAHLVAVGQLGQYIAEGALAEGLAPAQVVKTPEIDQAIVAVQRHHDARRPMLLKASRGLRLERIWNALDTKGDA